jgi:DNA-binding NarL/FixJ family response regulator
MAKKVIAYDDEPSLRKHLESIFYPIRQEFNLAATFPHAEDVLRHIETYKPDIILLDIEFKEQDDDGLIALYNIKKRFPEQHVLMLTTFDHDEKVFNALCLKADGYMLKTDFVNNVAHEFMRRSLNIILSGGAYITPSIAKKILLLFQDNSIGTKIQTVVERFKNIFSQSNRPKKHNDMAIYNLKPIQIEILEDIVAGKTTPKIAQERGIPENTINHHIKGIFRELEVHTRAQAVSKAIEERIVKIKNN